MTLFGPPQCERELSVAEGEAVPPGQDFCIVAYLVAYRVPCPPCPPDAECEACLPEYEQIGDDPPGTYGGATAWANIPGAGGGPGSPAVGDRLLLWGAWMTVNEPFADRFFSVMSVGTPSPSPPAP